MDGIDEHLLGGVADNEGCADQNKERFVLYSTRFYVLFAFMITSFNQCFFWVTFSPITQETTSYYQISENTVNLMLNWGPIIYIPATLPAMWLAKQRGGLKKVVLCAASMQFTCVLLRMIPCWLPNQLLASHGGSKDAGLALVHFAQILNAACGPLVMAPPTLLSQTWFGPTERTTATAAAILANNFGAALGFIAGPGLVQQGHPTQVPRLLYLHLLSGSLGLLLVLLYFPTAPPTPPSSTAATSAASKSDEGGNGREEGELTFVEGIRAVLRSHHFMALAVAGGVINGVFNAWSGILNVILRPAGCDPHAQGVCYSDSETGWFSFSSTIAAIGGGLVVGYVADHCFRRRFKLLLLSLLAFCLLAFVWFTISLPVPGLSAKTAGVIASSEATILLSITCAGLFLGASAPLFFELALELTYPVSEDMNLVMSGTVAFAIVLVFGVAERYRRADAAEEIQRSGYGGGHKHKDAHASAL